MYRVQCIECLGNILYSAKFSQVFNFANFATFQQFAKLFQQKSKNLKPPSGIGLSKEGVWSFLRYVYKPSLTHVFLKTAGLVVMQKDASVHDTIECFEGISVNLQP